MKESLIAWTDHTFNPWMGCEKVSPGCINCYAETATPSRVFGIKWGAGEPRKRTSVSSWNRVRSLDRKAKKDRIRIKVFCASLSDWLDPAVPSEWLNDLLELIVETPHLDWQLLTKRPEHFQARMNAVMAEFKGKPGAEIANQWVTFKNAPQNVWFGVTAENQETFNSRVMQTTFIPAKLTFLSMEPLLGAVNIDFAIGKVDWIIVGGESGAAAGSNANGQARACKVEWINAIVSRAQQIGISVFVKQLGTNAYRMNQLVKTTHPKGGNFEEFPEKLKIREFPVFSLPIPEIPCATY